MKQQIRVVGMVRNSDGELLFLKKRLDRAENSVLWELLTSKINFGEQPEEAISRAVFEYLGVHVASVKLKDAVTFLGMSGRGQLNNLFIVYEIVVQRDVKIVPSLRYSAYKYVDVFNNANVLRLTDESLSIIQIERDKAGYDNGREVVDGNISFEKAANGATVFVDGSSRGNPGPAGIGYYIVNENGEKIKSGGEFVGFATSRVAEYYAMRQGCEQAKNLGLKSVRFVSDNLMMVNQLNGIYKIKNADLLPIYKDIQELLKNFEAVAFVHMKRERNVEADREANLAIDRHFDESVIK